MKQLHLWTKHEDEFKQIIADELNVKDVLFVGQDFDSQPYHSTTSNGRTTVSLDTRINEALAEEGLLRDVMRFIQNERKAQGFALKDKIRIDYFTTDHRLALAIAKHNRWVGQEVQAVAVVGHITELKDGVRKRFGDSVLMVHLAHARDEDAT